MQGTLLLVLSVLSAFVTAQSESSVFDSAFLECAAKGRAEGQAKGGGCGWDIISLHAIKCLVEGQWAETGLATESGKPRSLTAAGTRVSATNVLAEISSSIATRASIPFNWSLVDVTIAEQFFSNDIRGKPAFNAYVLTAAQAGDLVSEPYHVAQDLTRLLPRAPALAWSSYLPFYRERAAVFDGKVVGIPAQGYAVHLYYRRDLFSAAGLRPPRTWDEAIAIARRFNGTDLDGDGAANDYGMCMWQPATCFSGSQPLAAVLSAMALARGDVGGMWFNPATMKSLVNTAAWPRALQTLSQLAAYSAPMAPKADTDCAYQPLFGQGRCAMAIGSPIQFKYDSLEVPVVPGQRPSRVRGRIGVAELPGSPVVLDWETDTMQPCDPARCPFAVPISTSDLLAQTLSAPPDTPHLLPNSSGVAVSSSVTANSSAAANDNSSSSNGAAGTTWVNVAPYTSWVGNVAYVNAKKSAQEQLATFFLFAQALNPENSWSLVASPVNFGPTRTQHLDPANRGRWLAYGYHEADLDAFLSATASSLASRNIASDLRSVAATNITLVLLRAVAQVAVGMPPVVVTNTTRVAYEAFWGVANVGAIGASYRASIYYGSSEDASPSPTTPASTSSSSSAGSAAVLVPALVASLGGLVLLLGLGIAVWRLQHHRNNWLVRRIRRIVPPGVGSNTTLTVTDIMDSTLLWESLPADVMDVALHLHHDCLRRLATVCGGYESMTEGDSFIFAYHSAQAALLFCLTAQDELPHLDWPEQLLQHESCQPLWAIEVVKPPPRSLPVQSPKRRGGIGLALGLGPSASVTAALRAPSVTQRLRQALSPRGTGSGLATPAAAASSPARRLRDSRSSSRQLRASIDLGEHSLALLQLQQQEQSAPARQQTAHGQQALLLDTWPTPAGTDTAAAAVDRVDDWRWQQTARGARAAAAAAAQGLYTSSGRGTCSIPEGRVQQAVVDGSSRNSCTRGARGNAVGVQEAAAAAAVDAADIPSLPSCAIGVSESITADLEPCMPAATAGSLSVDQQHALTAVSYQAHDRALRAQLLLPSPSQAGRVTAGARSVASGNAVGGGASRVTWPDVLLPAGAREPVGVSYEDAAAAAEGGPADGCELSDTRADRRKGQQRVKAAGGREAAEAFALEATSAAATGGVVVAQAAAAATFDVCAASGGGGGRQRVISRLGGAAARAASYRALHVGQTSCRTLQASMIQPPFGAAVSCLDSPAAAASAQYATGPQMVRAGSMTPPSSNQQLPHRSADQNQPLCQSSAGQLHVPGGTRSRPVSSTATWQQCPTDAACVGPCSSSSGLRWAQADPPAARRQVTAATSGDAYSDSGARQQLLTAPVPAAANSGVPMFASSTYSGATCFVSPTSKLRSRSRLLNLRTEQVPAQHLPRAMTQESPLDCRAEDTSVCAGDSCTHHEQQLQLATSTSIKNLLHSSIRFSNQGTDRPSAAAATTALARDSVKGRSRRRPRAAVAAAATGASALVLPERFALPAKEASAQLQLAQQRTGGILSLGGFGLAGAAAPPAKSHTTSGFVSCMRGRPPAAVCATGSLASMGAASMFGLPRATTVWGTCARDSSVVSYRTLPAVFPLDVPKLSHPDLQREREAAWSDGAMKSPGADNHLPVSLPRRTQPQPSPVAASLQASASMSDALEDLPTRTLGGDPCGIEEALAEAAEAEAQGAGDLARISAGVAGLTAVVSSYGNIAASGNGAAAEHGVSVLLLRGLRVRMGCASGVHSQAEVSYNTRMARTIYSGRPLAAAKAISGAGAGGIVLVSQCTHRLILKQRADAGGKQAAGYVELSLSDSVRAVGGDAAAAGSQRALFWYGGCAVLDPQLPPIELYQAATPAQALRWSALPLPASGPKVQPLSLCVQSAPVGQLAVAVVAVSGAGCIGTLEAPELAAGEGRDALDEPGTSPMWRAVAEQLWGEAARLCLAHGGYLSTRRSALIAMAPEVMADSVAAGPMSSAAANNSGDGVAGEYEKAPAAGRPQRRSLELARIGAALKAAGGGGRALRERAGRAGQVLLTAVFPSPTAAALWCAELLATGLCAPWPEQLLQSELGEAMWVGPGAVPAMEQLQKAPQEQQRQQVPPPPLQPHAQPAAAGASAAGGTTSASQMFCGTSSDVCGNVSGSAPAFMLGTSSKVSSGSQWHFRTSASPSQPHLLSASSQQQQQQLQQQQMQLFDKLPVSPADALGPLAPLQAHGGNSITAGSRAAAAEQPGQVASVEVDVEAVQQGSEPWRVEEPTMATAAMPASLDKPTHMHLQQHQQPTQQPTTTGVAISPPSAYTAVAGRAVGEAPEAEPASGAGPRQGADAASTHVVPGSEPLLCPYPWRDSGGGPEPDLRHSPARLPAAVLGQLVCRGPRLRAGVEFGSAAVEINPLTGAARYEGAAVSRAMALALSAPVTRVHVSERVAAAVGRMTAGSAESAAAGAECDGASASASALAGYLRSENGGALPPAEMLAFLRSALLVFGSGPQGMLAKQQ